MTNRQLVTLCTTWQRRLRLQDWDIFIRLARGYDMKDGKAGESAIHTLHKTAYIAVLDPHDAPAGIQPKYDPERTIVHELLHLPLERIVPRERSQENPNLEQFIETVAHALVNAYRCQDHSLKKSKSEPLPTRSSASRKRKSLKTTRR